MKIRLSELRRLIRESIIIEASKDGSVKKAPTKTPTKASTKASKKAPTKTPAKKTITKKPPTLPGPALAVEDQGDFRLFVLYDPTKMLRLYSTIDDENPDSLADSLYGVIMVGKTKRHKDKSGAKMVRYVHAQSGYGPKMYDIAMAEMEGIYGDRDQFTPEAENIWRFYKGTTETGEPKRPDVVNEPLSGKNIMNIDIDREENPNHHLNRAYFLKDGPRQSLYDIESWKANHEKFLREKSIQAKKNGKKDWEFSFADLTDPFSRSR